MVRPRSSTPALLLAITAIVACVAWGPAMEAVAQSLRPSQLDDISKYSDAELRAVIEPARLQMWSIAVASFFAIALLAVLAFVLGRRVMRTTANDQTLARLGTWAPWPLVVGLVLVVATVLLGTPLVSYVGGKLFYLSAWSSALVASLATAGALGSFILSGVALYRPTAESVGVAAQSPAWRGRARVCSVAAPLVVLLGFFLLALLAQFTVGFYLRLHFVF